MLLGVRSLPKVPAVKMLLIGPHPKTSAWDKKGLLAPCLGLRRIQSTLKTYGNVKVCDVINPQIVNTYQFLAKFAKAYNVIGFSPLHAGLELDLSMMWAAEHFNPFAKIVVGGVEATLNLAMQTLAPPNTWIVRGEGELPLLDLCRRVRVRPQALQVLTEEQFIRFTLNMDFQAIPYKKLWRETQRRYPNLSSVEVKTVRVVTSSHCPFRCKFCCTSHFIKGRIKYLHKEHLVTLLEKIHAEQPETKQVFFQDDNFLIGKKGKDRVAVFDELKLPFKLMAQCRLDDITPKSLPYLGNFRLLSVGVESFSQGILDDLGKNLKADSIADKITNIRQAGPELFINVILTSPNCTKKAVIHTLEQCRWWIDRGVEFGINLYPNAYPGSTLVKEYQPEVEKVLIPHTTMTFMKMTRILPKDAEIKKAILKVEHELKDEMLTSVQRSNAIVRLLLQELR